MKTYEYGKDNLTELFERLKQRSSEFRPDVEETCRDILNNVRDKGDKALLEYTRKFDGAAIDAIEVSKAEIESAFNAIDRNLLKTIKRAAANIRAFHEKQKENSWFTSSNGIILGQKVTPLERVGFMFRPVVRRFLQVF